MLADAQAERLERRRARARALGGEEKPGVEIAAELRSVASPIWATEAFAIEDPVDPRETRAYLCRFIDAHAESSRNDRRAQGEIGS